jgi:hypothetical protein
MKKSGERILLHLIIYRTERCREEAGSQRSISNDEGFISEFLT